MNIVKYHSHLNGLEWILVHRPKIWEEIEETIASVDASISKTKVSKEKTMKGKKLYSPPDLNNQFKQSFSLNGWNEERVDYWVTDDFRLIRKSLHLSADEQKKLIKSELKVPIKSYNQTDFVKGNVAIEVQFGKYSFIPYDMFVKHLAFYMSDVIEVGIEIVPMKSLQSQMSSGPGYYEGALFDMARQGRNVPAVPLVLIGIDV